jgi:hypothetical protein
VHIVSHCPYLIAQYSRYKGRDVLDTASAFLDVGYTLPKLVRITAALNFLFMPARSPDRDEFDPILTIAILHNLQVAEITRFPSMLAAPSDRIRCVTSILKST